MTTDPILEELYEVRERLAAKVNYDVFAIVADIQAQEQKEDQPLVSFSPKRSEDEEPLAKEFPTERGLTIESSSMITDSIIEELHRVREQLAQKFNYNVFAIVADAQAQQAKENRPIVSFSPKLIADEDPLTEAPQKRAA